MSERSGTIRDIRTGRAIGQTRDINHTFLEYCLSLVEAEKQFYCVTGPIRHSDVRKLVDYLVDTQITVVRDAQFPSDRVWIFEGEPEELGFAV